MSPGAETTSSTKTAVSRKTSATRPSSAKKSSSAKKTSSAKASAKTSAKKKTPRKNIHHNVYVIRLDDAVLKVRRFALANPGHVPGKPCVYVGMTGLTPEERFANHKAGVRSCGIVKRFGEHLMPGYYVTLNPMPFDKATKMEKRLAEELRRNGFAVWQN